MPTTASRIVFDKPMDILDELGFIGRGFGAIALGGAVLSAHATSPAFGDLMGLLKMLDGMPSIRRA